MKNKIIVVSICILVGLFAYVYFFLPPYYVQAHTAVFLKHKNYEKLYMLIEKYPLETSLSFRLGELKIEGKYNTNHQNNKELVAELMKENNFSPIINKKDMVLFYAGSASKFGKNIAISLLRKKKEVIKKVECNGQIKLKSFGDCYVNINKDWAIFYTWVKLM